nr:hypothetical protein CFP56_68356 [Quercus suber]
MSYCSSIFYTTLLCCPALQKTYYPNRGMVDHPSPNRGAMRCSTHVLHYSPIVGCRLSRSIFMTMPAHDSRSNAVRYGRIIRDPEPGQVQPYARRMQDDRMQPDVMLPTQPWPIPDFVLTDQD